MASTHSSCNSAQPFVKLGDGSAAPILNYNLPQKSCFSSNGYFPIRIPDGYLDPQFSNPPADSPWATAQGMALEQIIATLRRDALGSSTPILLQNAGLLRRRNGSIRFLSETGTSYLAADGKPETIVVSDSTLRVAQLGSEETTASHSNMHTGRINHLTALPTVEANKVQICGYTLEFLAQQVADGLMPEVYTEFGGRVAIRFLEKPISNPQITLVEHYKTCSFLGDYGAGKTVKTFSLLPGEHTTLTVKSYRDQTSSYVKSSTTNSNEYASTYYADDATSTAVKSENILDGFSQHAADVVQSNLDSYTTANNTSATQNNLAQQTGYGGGAQGGINLLGIVNTQAGFSTQVTNASSTQSNQIREESMGILHNALESAVNESQRYRDVEVNTTTGNTQNSSLGGNSGSSSSISVSQQEQTMIRSGEASTTVRHLYNINHSRVLNFVFRQMLQEYLVVTHLHDVSIVFSTGFAAQRRVVKLPQLDDLIEAVIPDADHRAEVRKAILLHLCNVLDHTGTRTAFAEKVSEQWTDCVDGTDPAPIVYWRKAVGLQQTYSSGGVAISVPGVITGVQRYILRTDSVIVDALLGQGEALDCYNARLQEEAALAAELRNARYVQETTQTKAKEDAALAAIAAISDPIQQADAWRKTFGEYGLEDTIAHLHLNGGTTN